MICTKVVKAINGVPTGDAPICIDSDPTSPTFGTAVDCSECTECEPTPLVSQDVEYVCNEDTNVYDICVIVVTDGEVTSETCTPTEIPCDQDPDFEKIRVCIGGTIHLQVCQFDEDGTKTVLEDVDTGEPCGTDLQLIRECRDGFINIVTYDLASGVKVEVEATATEEACLSQIVSVDTEYKCNSDTGFYDQCVITTTDGVPSEPVITATTIPCEDLPQDNELVTYCDLDTGTYHILSYEIVDNVSTLIEDVDTGKSCVPTTTNLDFELVCNEDTDLYDLYTFTVVDGIAGPPVITPTETPCDQNPPDFEKIRVCDPVTLTYHIQVCSFDEDGVKTVIEDIDTLQSCESCFGSSNCWKEKFFEGGLDNTKTSFRHTNQVFTVTFDDGSTDSFTIASATGWTDQVQQMATGLDGIWDCKETVEPFCTSGCGGLPAPVLVLEQMIARYVGFRFCPGCKAPLSVSYESDQTKAPKELVIQFKESDILYYDKLTSNCADECEDCFKLVGSETCECVEPICPIPCEVPFEELPETECDTVILDRGCDIVIPDPDAEDQEPIKTPIVLVSTTCKDGSSDSDWYTVDSDGGLELYNEGNGLVGDYGDCETCEGKDITLPRPDCGNYTGRTKCFEIKQNFKLIEKQFDETITGSQTVDVSADFGLPAGSIITTLDNQLWTGGAGTIAAVSTDNTSTFSVSGTQPVCIRVQHGGSIPQDGAQDCYTSNDGVPYTFTGTITGDGSFTDGVTGCVTSVTDNAQGGLKWESDGPATSVTASTTNGNAFNSVRFWVAICECKEVKEWVSCDGLVCNWYDGKIVVDITKLEEKPCPSGEVDCGQPTGDCRCYGGDGSSSSDYTYVNSDNETEGSFSMNDTTIKWSVGGGDGSLDGSIPYIDDCINGGGEATITITDTEGNTVVFVADTILQSSETGAAYTGSGPGGFSGKIREVSISCSNNEGGNSGKACSFIDCDDVVTWKDSKTGLTLTVEECETLVECTVPVTIEPPCEENIISLIACAAETVEGQAEIDDQILTVAVQDCEGLIIRSTQYNITQGNSELTEAVLTTDCDPQPDVEQIRECIVDSEGVLWTQLVVIDSDGTALGDPIYINQETLAIGTPSGEPKEWSSCIPEAIDFEESKVCGVDNTNPGIAIKAYRQTYYNGIDEPTVLYTSFNGQSLPLFEEYCCDDCIQVFGCRDGRLAFPEGATVELSNGNSLDIAGLRYSQVAQLIVDTYGGTYSAPSLGGPIGPQFSDCQGSSQHEIQLYNVPVDVVSITEMTNYGNFGKCAEDSCDKREREVCVKYPDTAGGCLEAYQIIDNCSNKVIGIELVDGTDVLSLVEECGIELEYIKCDCDCDPVVTDPGCPNLNFGDGPVFTNDVRDTSIVDAPVILWEAGDPITFPHQSGPNFLSDFTHCFRFEQSCCLLNLDPTLPITVRFTVDHEIEVFNGSHTGFNVNPGAGTIVNKWDNAWTQSTIGGPEGVRETRWIDIEYQLGDLLEGVCLTTGALGTSNTTNPDAPFGPEAHEDIYSYSLALSPDFITQLAAVLEGCPCEQ